MLRGFLDPRVLVGSALVRLPADKFGAGTNKKVSLSA